MIYGQVKGNVNCDGLITTMKNSIVSGSIITNFADISGKVDGNIEAKNKVSLSSTASLSGDLLASIIVIEEGAMFNGLCKMNSESEEKLQNSKVANLNEGQKSNWLRLSSIGFQIAGSLALFGWIGDLIDNRFDSNPIFLVFGLIFGATASLYQIWKMIDHK